MFVNIGPYPKDNEDREIDIRVDSHDLWSADCTLALIILAVLKQFRENVHSYPGEFADEDWHEEDDGELVNYGGDGQGIDGWYEILDKMIIGFELMTLDDWPTYRKEDSEIVSESLELFAKYFQHLWD